MIINSFFSGLGIGLSLIMAIGAQNAFVFRQGLLKRHIWLSILFCTISDGLLIFAGTYGIAAFLSPYFEKNASIIYFFTAIWLALYGILRVHAALFYQNNLELKNNGQLELYGVISSLFVMTWLNPHVYLDTLILIGSLSIPFGPNYLFSFALGATSASLIFFSLLGLGASKLNPLFKSEKAWKFVELLTAAIMFIFCFAFLKLGAWI